MCSLAYPLRPPLPNRIGRLVLAALAFGLAFFPARADDPPLSSGMVEFQEVHRVQFDVSVLAPHSDGRASVPGLTKDLFEILIDGTPLSAEAMAKVEFDEICPHSSPGYPLPSQNLGQDPRPVLIVLADLNYLDLGMRNQTSRALEKLADLAEKTPLRVKILVFGKKLQPLTSEITSDPAEIRRAAKELLASTASGPPLGGMAPLPTTRKKKGEPEDPTPISDRTDLTLPQDPGTSLVAFDVKSFLKEDHQIDRTFPEPSPSSRLGTNGLDPRPSLAAIESTLYSHSALQGRKALILFTSSWFDLPDDQWLQYAMGPRQAAQGGFTIWAVDAGGLQGTSGRYHSRLLGFLTSATGGETVRIAGRLSIAFERTLSQQSCYYLFSIPLQQTRGEKREHTVEFRIDNSHHPEYWKYDVRSAGRFFLFDSAERQRRQRVAALLEPDAFRLPEVRITASYPQGDDGNSSEVEVSTLLADLHFAPESSRGGFAAKMAVEGVVTDETGKTICTIGDGSERTIFTEQQPQRRPPALLIGRMKCRLPNPGLYELRALVQDLVTEDIGCARAKLLFSTPSARIAFVSSLRLGRNSGRDFLVDFSGPKDKEVTRDRNRVGFIPLFPGEGIYPQERLILRFVACGNGAVPAVALFQHPGRSAGSNEPHPTPSAPQYVLQLPTTSRSSLTNGDISCREHQAVLPENSLPPGSYGLALIESPPPPPKQIPEAFRILGSVEFTILPPPPTNSKQPTPPPA